MGVILESVFFDSQRASFRPAKSKMVEKLFTGLDFYDQMSRTSYV